MGHEEKYLLIGNVVARHRKPIARCSMSVPIPPPATAPISPPKEGEKDRHRLSGPLSGRGCAPPYDRPRQPILPAIIVAAQPAIVVVATQVERLVCWDELKVDVDLQTVQAFDYSSEAAKLLEQIKSAKLARVAAKNEAAERAKIARENELRELVFGFVLNDDDEHMGRHERWLAINDRLLTHGCGLEGKYPDLMKVTRLVHLVMSAKSGKPVGFKYKNLVEIGHHLFHQHPDLLLAYGFMLRAFGTKSVLDRDDRTGRWAAKVREERSSFLSDAKYKMAADEERLLAFLSQGASRKPANDNRDQDGGRAAA
jgi:hypothetical protein